MFVDGEEAKLRTQAMSTQEAICSNIATRDHRKSVIFVNFKQLQATSRINSSQPRDGQLKLLPMRVQDTLIIM